MEFKKTNSIEVTLPRHLTLGQLYSVLDDLSLEASHSSEVRFSSGSENYLRIQWGSTIPKKEEPEPF